MHIEAQVCKRGHKWQYKQDLRSDLSRIKMYLRVCFSADINADFIADCSMD